MLYGPEGCSMEQFHYHTVVFGFGAGEGYHLVLFYQYWFGLYGPFPKGMTLQLGTTGEVINMHPSLLLVFFMFTGRIPFSLPYTNITMKFKFLINKVYYNLDIKSFNTNE